MRNLKMLRSRGYLCTLGMYVLAALLAIGALPSQGEAATGPQMLPMTGKGTLVVEVSGNLGYARANNPNARAEVSLDYSAPLQIPLANAQNPVRFTFNDVAFGTHSVRASMAYHCSQTKSIEMGLTALGQPRTVSFQLSGMTSDRRAC